jgi:N-dimethylarginine dimethylaminohydrolase
MSTKPLFGVHSEVGQLRKVMVCAPGRAHMRLTPSNCDALLFDDVLWVDVAKRDHFDFMTKMRDRGVEVVEMHNLLAQTVAIPEARKWILDQQIVPNQVGLELIDELRNYLEGLSDRELAETLIGGLSTHEFPDEIGGEMLALIRDAAGVAEYLLPPLPNTIYTRDTTCWIYGGVTLNPLYWPARHEETILVAAIYRFHPDFAGSTVWWGDPEQDWESSTFEGGDVMPVGNGVVLMGMSERTSRQAITQVAAALFAEGARTAFGAPVGGPLPAIGGGPSRSGGGGKGWLWVSLAVVLVLVLGTGITLAVVQPWSGDDATPSAEGGAGGEEEPAGEPAPERVGDSDRAARSDFDGDGRGDVAGVFYNGDNWAQVTLTSGEGEFEVAREPGASTNLLWNDWNGDGTADALRWTHSTYRGGLTIRPLDGADIAEQSFEQMELWEDASYNLKVVTGDFDGDGLPDLLVVGQTAPLKVTLWVLRGTGSGFEDPEAWITIDDATYGSTQVFPGDHDGDGTDDLVVLLPKDAGDIPRDQRASGYFYGDVGVQLLLSTGDGFEAENNRLGKTPFDERLRFPNEYVVGDFRGDGSTMVGVQDPSYRSDDIYFFEYADGEFQRTKVVAKPSGRHRGMTAVDVNGNGRDDLVMAVPDAARFDDVSALKLEVALSDGDGFGDAELWGELACSEGCWIIFDQPHRA